MSTDSTAGSKVSSVELLAISPQLQKNYSVIREIHLVASLLYLRVAVRHAVFTSYFY